MDFLIEFGVGKLSYRSMRFTDGSCGVEIRAHYHGGTCTAVEKVDEKTWQAYPLLGQITFATPESVDHFIARLREAKALPQPAVETWEHP